MDVRKIGLKKPECWKTKKLMQMTLLEYIQESDVSLDRNCFGPSPMSTFECLFLFGSQNCAQNSLILKWTRFGKKPYRAVQVLCLILQYRLRYHSSIV